MTQTQEHAVGVRPLDREDWRELFDRLSTADDLWVTIEIEGDLIGGTEVARLPLACISHEDGDDQVAVAVGGRTRRYPAVLWHFVDRPRRVQVSEDGDRLVGLAVTGADGTRTVLRLWPEQHDRGR